MTTTYRQYIAQAEDCLARAYGDVSGPEEQKFYHDRALVYATLAVAVKPNAEFGQ